MTKKDCIWCWGFGRKNCRKHWHNGEEMILPKIYRCTKCDRYTDVRYLHDKYGDREKSYCYKCGCEIYMEPVWVNTEPMVKE